MRVLFLPRYGPLAGSSRYMTYDYLPFFEKEGIECTVNPFLDDFYLALSRKPSGEWGKSVKLKMYVLWRLLMRFLYILTAKRYDVIVLEKDVVPYLPYGFEALLYFFNHNVIVMYDERTDVSYARHKRSFIRKLSAGKIKRIIINAAHIIVWNPTVLRFAKRYNKSVTELSTGIDLDRYKIKDSYSISNRSIRIGWIGSPSGYGYVKDIEPALEKLSSIYDIELHIISSDPYTSDVVKVVNHSWSVETEAKDLRSMDIGIMPLPNTKWAAGKSGCKMFQYMAVGLPVVVSPVGINGQVVKDGVNGLLAQTTEEWFHQLAKLIDDEELRRRLGEEGRKYVEEHNSLTANAEKFAHILREVAKSK